MRSRGTCKDCGAPILWAQQLGGNRWYALEPEILGQPGQSDYPVLAVMWPKPDERVKKVRSRFVDDAAEESHLGDEWELHRRHECDPDPGKVRVRLLHGARVTRHEPSGACGPLGGGPTRTLS